MNNKKTEIITYHCPQCDAQSDSQQLLKEQYSWSTQQLSNIDLPPEILSEVFLCKCGRKNSWFDMIERYHYEEI